MKQLHTCQIQINTSIKAKLVPGVDLVPFWSMAVASVWRKAKRVAESEKRVEVLPPAR